MTQHELYIYEIVPQIFFIFADIQSLQILSRFLYLTFLAFFIHRSISRKKLFIRNDNIYYSNSIQQYENA